MYTYNIICSWSCLFIVILFCVNSSAQVGTLDFDIPIKSTTLNSIQEYSVYLPNGYAKGSSLFPIVYLLDGVSDLPEDRKYFTQTLNTIYDASKPSSVQDMIIVILYLDEKSKGYFNTMDEEWLFEDFFFDEFIPLIEKTYRVKSGQAYRSIAGKSNGGSAAFIYSLNRPDLFTVVAPINGAVGSLDYPSFKTAVEEQIKGIEANEIQVYYDAHQALSLLNNGIDEELKHLSWYIDCVANSDDFSGNRLFRLSLEQKEFVYKFIGRESYSKSVFFDEVVPNFLSFFSDKVLSGK